MQYFTREKRKNSKDASDDSYKNDNVKKVMDDQYGSSPVLK